MHLYYDHAYDFYFPKESAMAKQEEIEHKAEEVLHDMMKEDRTKLLQFFLSNLAKEMHKVNATDLELSCELSVENKRYKVISKCELIEV